MARNSLLCADVPLRNYSLTHSLDSDRSTKTIASPSHRTNCFDRYYRLSDYRISALSS